MAISNDKSRPNLDAALRWVGDLDHPYYQDERHRYVWYEASAIGFQFVLMVQLVLGGVLMLALGRDSLKLIAVGLLPALVASLLVAGYAHRRGARYFITSSDMRGARGIAGMAVVAIYVAGVLRLGLEDRGDETGFWADFQPMLLMGFSAGIVVGIVTTIIGKRRQPLAEASTNED